MTKTILNFTAIALTIVILSCSQSSIYKPDPSLYVGTNRVMDLTIPYPYFIDIRDNKIQFIDYNGKHIDSCLLNKKITTKDTLALNNHTFEVLHYATSKLNIFQLNDSVRFPFYKGRANYKYRAKMVPALMTKPLSSQDIRQNLMNKIFRCEVEADNPNDHLTVTKYLTFGKDSLKTTLIYSYDNEVVFSEYQTQKLNLYNIGEKVFLNLTEREDNPQPIYQVLENRSNILKLRYYNGDHDVISTFEESKLPNVSVSHYANCFDGHVGEYYHNRVDITYKYGNEFLIKKIGQNAPLDKGDGYIIVHYNVNCKDQMGRPGLIMMDMNYQNTTFGKGLVNHIIKEVMKLKEWPSSIHDDDNKGFYDIHGFLMFKIENGKITDLCP